MIKRNIVGVATKLNYNLKIKYKYNFKFCSKIKPNYDYDLFVIGGGSGGLSASREASKLGKKVGLADYIVPSPLGTKWGLGGTCVNVGCIPKKLFHNAALKVEDLDSLNSIGLDIEYKSIHKKNDQSDIKKVLPIVKWNILKNKIQMHIKKINFSFRAKLREEKVTYHNKYASFIDKNTILLKDNKNNETIVTADKILIAVGGRPNYGNYKNSKELCLTSDDIFSLNTTHPGKVLIIGASYIALECAGFLNGLGCDVTIMVRSKVLGGFDKECAEKVADYMKEKGIKFLYNTVPEEILKNKTLLSNISNSNKNDVDYLNIENLLDKKDIDRDILVTYKNEKGSKIESYYDNVLMAIGRTPTTESLNVEKAGVQIDLKTNKIITDDHEKTSIDNIYAIGDCALNRPELTPPAIKVIII